MLASLLIVAAAVSQAVLAAPTIVPTSQCFTIAEGFFSADTTIFSDPFSLTPNGTLAFGPATMVSFHVEFQTCTPNFAGYSNINVGVNGTYAGHLFVPSLDMCLSVQTPGVAPPYTAIAVPCQFADDSSQVFQNWVMTNQKIFFSGNTREDGSVFQGEGACPGSGLFGYQGDDQAIPTVIGTTTPLVCATGADVHGFTIIN